MENEKTRPASWLAPATAVLLVLAELLWLGLLTWKVWSQPVPVTFDMRGTVDTFTAQTAEQHLSDDEKARLVTRFNAALTQSLADWSDVYHRPVLVKAAVVSGLDDITAEIQQDIGNRMRQGGQ
ncbi:TrbI F-type domain-containing protein (plasmid) [Citrobacter cronae]